MLALILCALVACAAVGALAYITLRSQLAPGPSLVGRTLEVQTDRLVDDQTIRGICVAQHSDRWSFVDAVYRHDSGDQPIHDPIVHIMRHKIVWYTEPDGVVPPVRRPIFPRRGLAVPYRKPDPVGKVTHGA